MSGLLQRLAGYATIANTGGSHIGKGGIRPAASVHATPAAVFPADVEFEQVSQPFSHPPGEARLAEERRAAWIAERGLKIPLAAMSEHAAEASAFAGSQTVSPPRVAGITTQLRESSPALERRTPQALLDEPLAAPSPVSPITPPRMAIAAAPQPVANESTEVHVHIARIEVSAVQESAAPKRPRASSRRETQSLDEYLASRRRP